MTFRQGRIMDSNERDLMSGSTREESGLRKLPPPRIEAIQDKCETIEEKDIPQILSINDITISPTLESLLQSLLGSILICSHKPREEMCEQCKTRVDKVERIRTQVKAEMLTLFDLRRKFSKLQDDNTTLRTYIDTNEPIGTADSIIRQSSMRIV